MPLSFMPPNGAISVEMMPSLMPTIPYGRLTTRSPPKWAKVRLSRISYRSNAKAILAHSCDRHGLVRVVDPDRIKAFVRAPTVICCARSMASCMCAPLVSSAVRDLSRADAIAAAEAQAARESDPSGIRLYATRLTDRSCGAREMPPEVPFRKSSRFLLPLGMGTQSTA
jgi:hypothetical protein